MKKRTPEETIEIIARALASEEHAASLWRDRDWDWYAAQREATLNMLRRGEKLELRHLQFIWFVQKYLSAGALARLPEEARFLQSPGTRELRELANTPPPWSVDGCELFDSMR